MFVGSKVEISIVPSNVSCTRQPYVTISHFAAHSKRYIEGDTTVTLQIWPGSHILHKTLSLSHLQNLTLVKYALTDSVSDSALVQCTYKPKGKFEISNIAVVSIKSLQFKSCIGMRLTMLTSDDIVFQNIEGYILSGQVY